MDFEPLRDRIDRHIGGSCQLMEQYLRETPLLNFSASSIQQLINPETGNPWTPVFVSDESMTLSVMKFCLAITQAIIFRLLLYWPMDMDNAIQKGLC